MIILVDYNSFRLLNVAEFIQAEIGPAARLHWTPAASPPVSLFLDCLIRYEKEQHFGEASADSDTT